MAGSSHSKTPPPSSMTTLQVSLDAVPLDACIHCGMCLPACPTYEATGSEAESPRGRLHLMKAWAKGHLETPQQLQDHLDPCLGCMSCQTACPSGVQYGDILFQVRSALNQSQPMTWGRRVKRLAMAWVLPNPKVLKVLTWAMKVYQTSPVARYLRYSQVLDLLPPLNHWEAMAPPLHEPLLPAPPRGARFKAIDPEQGGAPFRGTVALFLGCVMESMFSAIHWDTLTVLLHNGYDVVIPAGQTCCGALPHHSGDGDIAETLVKKNVKQLAGESDTAIDWIVLNAAGCGATLKHYDQLLPEDHPHRPGAQTLAHKTVDILELLAQHPLAPMSHEVLSHITYHPPCHLHHGQGIIHEPLAILRQIPGVTLTVLPEAEKCCGSAGVYNLEHPDLSREVLAAKMENILSTGAETVVTGNPGCHLQLDYGLRHLSELPKPYPLSAWDEGKKPLEVRHPISLLAQGYGGSLDESGRPKWTPVGGQEPVVEPPSPSHESPPEEDPTP